MIKNCLVVFIICLAWTISNAQSYSYVSYNTAQGLPQTQVTSIAQDREGYLWIGTLGGLSKFNGKEFQSFSTKNGILNIKVTFLKFIDDDLWIGHEGGISKIGNNKIQKWAFGSDFKTTKVTDIVNFQNKIIIASNGGGLFELKDNVLKQLQLNGSNSGNLPIVGQSEIQMYQEDDLRIRDLLVFDNELLIGTRGGILRTTNLKTSRHINSLNGFSVSGMEKDGKNLLITTFNDGLLNCDLSTEKWNKIIEIDSLLTLRGCVKDSKGNLWVNSSDGVMRLKNGKINLKLNQSNGLPMESIKTVFEDRQGNIWLGSEGKGLLRFPGEMFVYYNENNGLTSDLILNVNQDKKGNYWIGTMDGGLMMMSGKKIVPINIETNNTIWTSVLDIDGLNWFGTGSGLVSIKNQTVSKVYYSENGLPGDKITALLKMSQHSFYVGGSEGVSFYDQGKFSLLKIRDAVTVRDFCKTGNKVYCATDKGLYLIQGNRLESVYKFNKTIYSIVKDIENSLWIGTEEGLFRLKEGRIEQIPFSIDPSSNFINFLNYSNQKLFIGTNNGLFVLSNIQGNDFDIKNYGIAEGVVNLETNINSSFIDKNGLLWFGTASGLVSFFPPQKNEKFPLPLLVLKNILINYQQIDFGKFSDGINKQGLPLNLRLPFTKNNLTFEMDGISLANFPGMQFQFWLEGQDSKWTPLNSNTTITFNGLSAGDYILHARCVDVKGNMSKEIIFEFTVKQAFYKTWWFVGGLILLIGLLVYRIFKFRLQREREKNDREKMEYKSKLLTLEQKSLNASMNRHFIFNSLNSIQYFINTQDRLSANRFLTNFAKLIRKNLDSSEDGNLVSLSQELERLELYLSLESMRFKDRFEYKINCQKDIDTESVVIPAMMLQPFIENSIIHGILPDESKKGIISLDIQLQKDILIIKISDNGVGIETSLKNKINYDGDHRSQGMEITTKRIELLKKLTNRSFELIGPIQIMNNDGSINGTCVTLKFQIENLDY